MLLSEDVDQDFEFSVNAILSGHSQDVKFVKWHPTENLLFSSSYDNTIKCWVYDNSVDDWLCSFTITGHESTIWQIDFDTTGKFLAACSEDKKWSVWNIQDTRTFSNKGIFPNHHMRSIYSISWSKALQNQDSELIATGSSDNRICVFEVSKKDLLENSNENVSYNTLVQKNMAHQNDINCVEFCPSDPKILASCSDDGLVKIWRINV